MKNKQTIQICTLIFIISAIINQLGAIVMMSEILGQIIWLISVIAYILLWISYSISRKISSKSTSYLGVLLLILTLEAVTIRFGFDLWMGSQISKLGPAAETITDLSLHIPNYASITGAIAIISVVLNIIYIAIAVKILLSNKDSKVENESVEL
ncbi:MAG: hypothetical protein ACRC6X_03710 [Culicoidibacterales bacterium]